jgi:hypothetical protein
MSFSLDEVLSAANNAAEVNRIKKALRIICSPAR